MQYFVAFVMRIIIHKCLDPPSLPAVIHTCLHTSERRTRPPSRCYAVGKKNLLSDDDDGMEGWGDGPWEKKKEKKRK